VVIDPATFGLLAEGAIDVPAQQSWFRMEVTGYSFDPEVLSEEEGWIFGDIDAEGLDFTFEFIQDGTTSYARIPFLTLFFGTGADKWIVSEDSGGGEADGLAEEFDFDVDDLRAYLDAIEGDLEVIGTEEIRGVATTHIRATLDPTMLPEDDGLLSPIGASGNAHPVPVDVWLDEQGRLHKLEFTIAISDDEFLPVAGESDLEGVTGTFSFSLYNYGEPIELPIPGPDEIIGEDELFGGLFGDIELEEGDVEDVEVLHAFTPEADEFFDLSTGLFFALTNEDWTRLETEFPALLDEYWELDATPYDEIRGEHVAQLRDIIERMEAALGKELVAE
jgi:hypothetical protein